MKKIILILFIINLSGTALLYFENRNISKTQKALEKRLNTIEDRFEKQKRLLLIIDDDLQSLTNEHEYLQQRINRIENYLGFERY